MTMAIANPSDAELLKRLGQIAQIPVSPVFALPQEINDAIAIHYCTEKGLEDSLNQLERSSIFDQPDNAGERLASLAEANGLIKILDEIIYYGMRERATDIHIEAQETQSRIRFRVDGNLREILTYSRKLHRALISRVKILCGLNISETRFPQDGRFSMPIGSQTANFRVSTIPSAYGEKVVIRILAMTGKTTMLTLEKMMISQTILQPFKRIIQNPNGIIFVTGPTGSGKTTTLYAALHEINTPGINISTIEDPIEIQLAGVNQSQVNAHIDLKFATLLRALMRQDPDAILVGEIRDLETAKIATEAALTGHIVFATLHTNSAPQAITRLIEIGVEPYMVAPSVVGVLAQRLAARICESCKEAYYPSRETLAKFFKEDGLTEVPFYRGKGCTKCRYTGFKGPRRVSRTGTYHRGDSHTYLRRTQRAGYFQGCRQGRLQAAALRRSEKVLLGLTTIEEIEQSTSFEWET